MIRCLWSFGHLEMASAATVLGNSSSLQVVTCKYLIFCTHDKYHLKSPHHHHHHYHHHHHQVWAFAQKQLTLTVRCLINFRPRPAKFPALLSHGCPIIGRAAPMYFFINCSDWAQISWKRHQMETFSALLAICAGNSPVPGEFPAQRPVTRNFDVFFDLRPNKRFSKQWWGWWVETPSSPLWRHCNVVGEPPDGTPHACPVPPV